MSHMIVTPNVALRPVINTELNLKYHRFYPYILKVKIFNVDFKNNLQVIMGPILQKNLRQRPNACINLTDYFLINYTFFLE
jgi:hypothetical protein